MGAKYKNSIIACQPVLTGVANALIAEGSGAGEQSNTLRPLSIPSREVSLTLNPLSLIRKALFAHQRTLFFKSSPASTPSPNSTRHHHSFPTFTRFATMSALSDIFTLPVILGCIAAVVFLIGLAALIKIGLGKDSNENRTLAR